eukprot:767755-Rhodomonas_salina.2
MIESESRGQTAWRSTARAVPEKRVDSAREVRLDADPRRQPLQVRARFRVQRRRERRAADRRLGNGRLDMFR